MFSEDDPKARFVDQAVPTDHFHLEVLEWHDGQRTGKEKSFSSAHDLIQDENHVGLSLRVVFAPLILDRDGARQDHRTLMDHFSVPPAFFQGRSSGLTHSFGTRRFEDGKVDVCWSHFIGKDISLTVQDGQVCIYESGPLSDKNSQSNTSWIRTDFFIHTIRPTIAAASASNVTLICFGAPARIKDRFRRALNRADWADALQEPYILFDVLFDELFTLVDLNAWRLADAFRPAEQEVLKLAQQGSAPNVDFTGLHNLSKHAIYMNETVEAAMHILSSILPQLSDPRRKPTSRQTDFVTESLEYRLQNFHSTHLRLDSLEKRMANVISLSFNLVTQYDSRVMQNDSRAMVAIAVLTFFFLPATGISSIFSTPFFNVDFDNGSGPLQVTSSFWIFWAFSLPLTIVTFALWWVFYKKPYQRWSGRNIRKAQKLDIALTQIWKASDGKIS